MTRIAIFAFALFITNISLSSTFVKTAGTKPFPVLQEPDKEKDNITMNMARAWIRFQDEDYYGALRIYRDLYEASPDNALLNYKMGECYVMVKEMKEAISHLKKVEDTDSLAHKDLFLLLGKAYQYEEQLDEAIDAYHKYKQQLKPKQLERHHVNELLRQCITAKELMNNPVNVKIKNMGTNINSKYTDASPSLSADGSTFIFTTRRPETKGGNIEPSNNEYYDDVFLSTWDDNSNSWSKAVNIPGSINTEGHDANTSISPDGKTIFLYKNIEGETKSGDIYTSIKKDDGSWAKPKPLDKNINSTYFESSACITADGKTLYFVSERIKDGFGNGDIYSARKIGSIWSKPENLGPVINTINDEIGVFIHPDGKTLFFSSNGHNNMGGHDIFMSTIQDDGKWSEPLNLGYPINTPKEEIHFILTTNGQKAYLSSSRDNGMGKTDIYEIDMSKYFESKTDIDKDLASALSGPPLSILKGTVVDSRTSAPVEADITIRNMSSNEKPVIISSNEKGEYFITLPAEEKYEITIEHKGYKPFSTKFKLPKGASETYTLVKHLVLNKK